MGYCSNSPLRCVNAQTLVVINEKDNCCPECGLFLVPTNDKNSNALVELQNLYLSLGFIAIMTLALVYIGYKNFV